MKFAVIQPSIYTKPAPVQDSQFPDRDPPRFPRSRTLTDPRVFPAADVLFDHKWADEDLLGMDHLDKKRSVGEKGVFIREYFLQAISSARRASPHFAARCLVNRMIVRIPS